jgi:hypothetical protein
MKGFVNSKIKFFFIYMLLGKFYFISSVERITRITTVCVLKDFCYQCDHMKDDEME